MKRPKWEQKWMNVWSISKELVPAGKHIYGISEAEVRKKASDFGPIPRHVLQQNQDANSMELEKAITGCRFKDLEFCMLKTATAPEEMSRKLFFVEVEEDFSEGDVRFASAQIEAELAAKLERESSKKTNRFLRTWGGIPALQSLRRSILERTNAHRVLQNGGRFLCRDLDTQADFWTELPFCANSEDIRDHSAIASLQLGVYGKGVYIHNLGGVDAVVKPGKLYQITVSERHKIQLSALSSIAERMGGLDNLELYWVADHQTFTSDFRKQTFAETKDTTAAVARQARGIKQYLLQLPNDIKLMPAHQDSDNEDTEMD